MIAAAARALNPVLSINGMVSVPVVAAPATALPESEPIMAFATTETLAAPPTVPRNTRRAEVVMKRMAPVCCSAAPKTTNRNT